MSAALALVEHLAEVRRITPATVATVARKSKSITPETAKLAGLAVAAINFLITGLRPEERFEWKADLRQDLLIKLWDGRLRPELAGIKLAARNETLNMLAHRGATIRQEREYASGLDKPGTTRRGPDWSPTWYPPMDGAEQYAPFAYAGARMMHLKETKNHADLDEATCEFIDSLREPAASSR